MANGAIADTQILCSTYDESFDSFCKPCQNARSRVDNNGGSWWCIPSTVTEPWFQVSFSEPVIVLKVLIESHSSDHFPRSIKFFSTTEDPINENFIPFYHDTASDQVCTILASLFMYIVNLQNVHFNIFVRRYKQRSDCIIFKQRWWCSYIYLFIHRWVSKKYFCLDVQHSNPPWPLFTPTLELKHILLSKSLPTHFIVHHYF